VAGDAGIAKKDYIYMKAINKSFFNKVEFRTTENEGKRIIEAVIPYNSKSADLGGYREVITDTAFKRSLEENHNIFAYYNHDDNKILGSTKSETLQLRSENEGLYCKLFLGNSNFANDAWDVISRGDCNTLSFAFIPHEVENRGGLRYLKSVNLKEISFCVSQPAYEETNSIAYTRKNRTIYKGDKAMKEKLVTRSLNFELLQQLIDSGEKIDDEETAKEIIGLVDPDVLKKITAAANDPTGGGTAEKEGQEKENRETEKEEISEAEKQEVLDEIEKELQKKDESESETEKEKEE
jgi:HK97 family phage prohead protease